MNRYRRVLLLASVLLVAKVEGLSYDTTGSFQWYDEHDLPKEKKGTNHSFPDPLVGGVYSPTVLEDGTPADCSHFAEVGLIHGQPLLYDLLLTWTDESRDKIDDPHKRTMCNALQTNDDGLPLLECVLPGLVGLGFDEEGYAMPVKQTWDFMSTQRAWRRGDIIMFNWRPAPGEQHAPPGHTVVINDPVTGGFWDHDGDRLERTWDDFVAGEWNKHGGADIIVISHPDPSSVAGDPQVDLTYMLRFDSSWNKNFRYQHGTQGGYTTHEQQCCWHENLANTWPWYSDSTAYACLTWPESSGTVWDSMISPRMNFAGDSAIQFRQSTYSSLQHLYQSTIAVKGSTDNGASWPFTLGDDSLTEATMPWADNQRNVRILWVYKGDPQQSNFWCIDDVEIWAKPTRNRDVSVSGVARPYGIVSQGRTITPAAFVWNHGKQPETLAVTMNIGSSYTDTKSVMLYPYNDTLLEFEHWSAIVGNYTATAFCAIDSDECRANDTASLALRVVGDSWFDLGEIYGNWGGGLGSCMAPVGDNEIWAVIGHQQYFAVYNCDQNLFVPKAQTPRTFSNGSGLAGDGCRECLTLRAEVLC